MPSSPAVIRFVYFDLGNVLVAFDRQLACQNVANLFAGDVEHVDEFLHIHGLQNELECGRISEQEFAATVRAKMLAAASDENLSATIAQIADQAILTAISDMFSPIESMRELLRSIRQSGIPVGILSNTCNAHWSWVHSQSYPVLEGPFDVCVVSHEVGAMKPDRLIYETATRRVSEFANVVPEEILFLDDKEENVLAARDHGWRAEVCFGGEEAEQVLLDYGVLANKVTRCETGLEAAPRS
ncbi:HAD family hydrolase [Aporhodopirellula aestuarii]|uniref:HAD family phosphatase n=1 Tax=Aporhodopirellula aestuarii TaxID=2950107 RepID=A0ABT0U2I9_9BACT|nr:HAD family phosphatase [Aporhodopirellula aestuarii]MCM2371013.1 HAD family phosphatase [Aporhodopirellula aestuarii]